LVKEKLVNTWRGLLISCGRRW